MCFMCLALVLWILSLKPIAIMNSSCLLEYQQPQMTMLELDSTGMCAASGNSSFNPSHFDDDEINW